MDNNQNKKGVALCVHGGDRDHDHVLHRHHPLLQAGEKNHDGGMLEPFMFSPIFFIIAREKNHFVYLFGFPPLFPSYFLFHPLLCFKQAGKNHVDSTLLRLLCIFPLFFH